jgi:hypothetical protein
VSIDTLKAERRGHTQDPASKATSGGGAKAPFKTRGDEPEGARSPGGDRAPAELTTPTVATDRHPDQSPEGEAIESGAGAVTRR